MRALASLGISSFRWVVALGAAAILVQFVPGCGSDVVETPDWASCTLTSQCVLRANTCCGTCGEPTLADVDAVNSDKVDAHQQEVCPNPVPCPDCISLVNPDLLATCTEGTCTAIDVRKDAVSACTADTDCRLRTQGCCECGGSTAEEDLIAVRVDAASDFAALACDPEVGCPACEPMYPTSVEAFCADDGHCDIRPVSCATDCAASGLTCCDGSCVATYNDVNNCGGCGVVCGGANPFCDGTNCVEPPCDGVACTANSFCCGTSCCNEGELCCDVPSGAMTGPMCIVPDDTGTCPTGCLLCP
ncbi:MAG: hypothetical protein U0271_45470 [Polyangiaceae bacterium]